MPSLILLATGGFRSTVQTPVGKYLIPRLPFQKLLPDITGNGIDRPRTYMTIPTILSKQVRLVYGFQL